MCEHIACDCHCAAHSRLIGVNKYYFHDLQLQMNSSTAKLTAGHVTCHVGIASLWKETSDLMLPSYVHLRQCSLLFEL